MSTVFAIVAIVGFLCAIIFVQAKICGWTDLPNEIPGLSKSEGERWRFSSIATSKTTGFYISLRSACSVNVGESGISISPHFPLRIAFHAASFLWGSVNAYTWTPGRKVRVTIYVSDCRQKIIFLGEPAIKILSELRNRGTPVYSDAISQRK